MPATDQQVQTFVNVRFRPFAEAARALYLAAVDHRASIDDVYNACLPQNNPTWEDNRDDGPPHILSPQDVLAWNAFMANLIMAIEGTPDQNTLAQITQNWATILRACVRPVI